MKGLGKPASSATIAWIDWFTSRFTEMGVAVNPRANSSAGGVPQTHSDSKTHLSILYLTFRPALFSDKSHCTRVDFPDLDPCLCSSIHGCDTEVSIEPIAMQELNRIPQACSYLLRSSA